MPGSTSFSVSLCCLIETSTYGNLIILHMQRDHFSFSTLVLTHSGFGFNSKDRAADVRNTYAWWKIVSVLGVFKMFWISFNFSLPPQHDFVFNGVFKSFYGRWVVWFDLWLGLHKIAFCWNIDETREPTVNPWELAIWQSENLRQMKSVTFEQSSPNVWK